ncbi:hypothetical protein Q8A67_025860 [Cirrhinus molitorella]|uniref:Uncharacterized protein n=1 Tax=Cirrhinus molitorella TaxID=172907 RepID=A0AA88P0E5_9TELE|nr:hypothetical protein Q8A67_025860 [Cirrhinus molitorella]
MKRHCFVGSPKTALTIAFAQEASGPTHRLDLTEVMVIISRDGGQPKLFTFFTQAADAALAFINTESHVALQQKHAALTDPLSSAITFVQQYVETLGVCCVPDNVPDIAPNQTHEPCSQQQTASFGGSRADDARQEPLSAREEEAHVDPGAAGAGARSSGVGRPEPEPREPPQPSVAQTHGRHQTLPLQLQSGGHGDERRASAGDQQEPDIRGAAAESCDQEEEEDELGQMERSGQEERAGGVACVCKCGLGTNQ